jgi:hypothetical protein
MWAKLAQLFFRRPDLVLNHIEAYAQQAERELAAAKKGLGKAIVGLLLGAFLLAMAISLLVLALMLDTALPVVAQRLWLYAAPAGLLLLAALLLGLSLRSLRQRSSQSELKRQAQADFALLRTLAKKKYEA